MCRPLLKGLSWLLALGILFGVSILNWDVVDGASWNKLYLN